LEALWARYGGEGEGEGEGEEGRYALTVEDEGGEGGAVGVGVGGEDDCDEDTTPRKAKTSLVDDYDEDDDDDEDEDDDSEGPPGFSTVTTPEGSRMKLRTSSHPIAILTKSAPSSMRREQTSASRAMLGASGEWSRDGDGDVSRTMTGRSCSSTGGIFETDVHAVEDFDRLADTLKFNAAMRREVQLGLAKALHTDFGQHDFHPDESHDDEEETEVETEVEEGGGGEAAVAGGDGPVDVVSPERRRCIVM